jgi:hypothetical protein
MNSEIYKEILTAESKHVQQQKEKQDMADSLVRAEGNAIELMMNTAGWKLVDRDLELLQAGLMNKLRHTEGLTKSTMDRYIDQMNIIEVFRKNPVKYINRMKMLIKRKVRE